MIRVPAKGPIPADWMLVGEAPGADEELKGVPFIGMAGRLLDGALTTVGLPRGSAYVTNVVKERPPKNRIEEWLTSVKKKASENGLVHETNGLFYNDYVKQGVQELLEDIERVQPKVIVAMGNTPLWALTGQTGIMKWRGSELWYGNSRLIPVVHPAAILRDMSLRPTLIHDLRYRVMGKMAHPEEGREPDWLFRTGRDRGYVFSNLIDLVQNRERGEWLSVDVETKKGRIDTVGVAWSNRAAISIPFIDATGARIWDERDERDIVQLLREWITDPRSRIIGQNFNYDAQYFERDPAFGFRVVCAHDTKVAQHVLLPGTDKDLVMLSSLYCDWHCYWKDDLKESADNLDDTKRWRYNCRDCVVTYEVAMKQITLLRAEGFL